MRKICIFLAIFIFSANLNFAGETTSGSQLLMPKLNIGKGRRNRYDPRICPRCTKPYTICIKKGNCLKAIEIPSRPWPCPVCRHVVNIPLEEMRCEDIDADLCPHPKVKVKFFSAIPLCPNCGFAAYQDDFRKKQSPETIAWIKRDMQPRIANALHKLMKVKVKLTHKQRVKYFGKQEDLPDVIRCTNATAYYNRLKASRRIQAKLCYLTAWAYRRKISSPIFGPYVMPAMRKINSMMSKIPDNNDNEKRINALSEAYASPQRFTHFERQMIKFTMAGYYNRLGYNDWSFKCLMQLKNSAIKKYSNPSSDPLYKSAQGTTEERAQIVRDQKNLIAITAAKRLDSMEFEKIFLAKSSEIMVACLKRGEYPPEYIATYVYLIGEFERRQENFSRAMLWLQASTKMLGPEIKAEHFSEEQIEKLLTYVKTRRLKPAKDKRFAEERKLLQTLIAKVKRYNELQQKEALKKSKIK